MKMRLTDPLLGELIYERDFTDRFQSGPGIKESKIEIDHALATASMLDMWFDGVHITYGTAKINKSVTVKAECDSPAIEMHFGISGNSVAEILGTRQKIQFDTGQHNICYYPEFEGYFRPESNEQIHEMLEVNVTEEYFNRFANTESLLMDRFQNQIARKQASLLNPKNLTITYGMQGILKEIMDCKRMGTMKRIFLESRVLELLMLQMEQFESDWASSKILQIRPGDLEKIHHAKLLIEQNISSPYSLTGLSRAVGLNDFKLKKGFKETFNTTVFGYLHELRMQQARRLLKDTSRSINDISEYCGYTYVQHFTTAFRNKFGVTPGSFRLG
jgi:AraC-like DNA-binding protein